VKKFNIFHIFFCFLAFVAFFGCSQPTAQTSKSVSFLIKSPNLKFNETGIVKFGENVRLEIYGSGVGVGVLNVGEKVCVSGVCFDKVAFNEKYLLRAHYGDFLSDILRGVPLYDGKNVVKNECGFSQNFDHMSYKVCAGTAEFRDEKNGIKIRIKDL